VAGALTAGTLPVGARRVGPGRELALPAEPAQLLGELHELALPAEPAQLLGELRELALEAPLLARDEVVRVLAKRLWRRWRTELAPLGLSSAGFRDDVAAYRRELWLWVVGERTWEQAIGGLAGRVSRRAGELGEARR
jgi:hypothetical protein